MVTGIGAASIKGTIGNETIGKGTTGKEPTGEAMIADRAVGILIAAPAIPPATNETEGAAAPSSLEVCQPRQPSKKKPGAPMRDAPGLMSIGAC